MKKLFGIMLFALVLAIFSAGSSLVNVTSNFNPVIAILIGIEDGFALENQSSNLFQQAVLENEGKIPKKFQSDVDSMALRAFAKEPLVPGAIALLALNRRQADGGQTTRKLMLLNRKLSKRTVMTQYWLANDYSEQGNIREAMAQYDIILRTNKAARNVLVTVLAKSLENDEFVEPIADVVRNGAPWVLDFWNEVRLHPGSLENAALLRIDLLEKSDPKPLPSDAKLVRALVQKQKFDAAANFYYAIQQVGVNHQETNLRTTEFSKEAIFSPLDWDIISEGDYGASVDGKENALFISALPGSRGIVARKLIKLTAGSYQTNVVLGQSQVPVENELEIVIRCAEKVSFKLSKITLSITKRKTASQIQTTDTCQYYWMELIVDSAENDNGLDMIIKEIRIERAVPKETGR